MLLLNTNKKPYNSFMGVPKNHDICPWVILKGQSQGHWGFEVLYIT